MIQRVDLVKASKIVVTQDCVNEDGFCFYKGETFGVAGEGNGEIEVKTAGEYVWIPAGHWEYVS